MTRRVTIDLGERTYPVVVGRGAVDEIATLIPPGARRAAVVTQEGIPPLIGDRLRHLEVVDVVIGSGEANKTLSTIEVVTRTFAASGLTRGDVVIGLGGGMVTDVAGFAAAVYHRGLAVVHLPTTLLGMVDAAIGGKTGVNLPEGKNLVGSFWQPVGVICDLDALDSLPEREIRCGNGEMAKYHFLVGDDLTSMTLEDRVTRCVEIKGEFVSADEREGGARALLNYGHTLGHAVEIATDHRVAHGEAVGIGLVFAAELAHRLGRIDRRRVDEHRHVVEEVYGLDSRLPDGIPASFLVGLMGRDKKALDGLTFVLDGDRGPEVCPGLDPGLVESTLMAMETRSI